jgi:hypothetical protein
VASEVVADAAVGEVPDLDELVPAAGDDDGGGLVGGEAHAGDPLGVAILDDGELALTEGVPELDGAVARARDDLTVVGGEGDGEDVLGVTDEAAGALAGVDVPETEGSIPRAREGELTIGTDDNIRDEVVVAVERALGDTVVAVLAVEVPDNDSLIAGSR